MFATTTPVPSKPMSHTPGASTFSRFHSVAAGAASIETGSTSSYSGASTTASTSSKATMSARSPASPVTLTVEEAQKDS